MPVATRLLPIALALFLPLTFGEVRDWTSHDGKKISGEFVRADSNSVTIRKDDGTTVDIPARLLAEEDLVYASRLAEEAKAAAEKAAAEAEVFSKKERERIKLLEGPITYELTGGHEDWPKDRKKRIVEAMESAIVFLNKHAKFKKHLWANNSPGTPTADANYEGWINWGGSISRRVALHEISHTLGIGTHPDWQKNIKDGKWTGRHAVAQLKEFDGEDAVLHADRQHFWPYGLNFDNESNPEADLRFIKMVEAFRKDLGIR